MITIWSCYGLPLCSSVLMQLYEWYFYNFFNYIKFTTIVVDIEFNVSKIFSVLVAITHISVTHLHQFFISKKTRRLLGYLLKHLLRYLLSTFLPTRTYSTIFSRYWVTISQSFKKLQIWIHFWDTSRFMNLLSFPNLKLFIKD